MAARTQESPSRAYHPSSDSIQWRVLDPQCLHIFLFFFLFSSLQVLHLGPPTARGSGRRHVAVGGLDPHAHGFADADRDTADGAHLRSGCAAIEGAFEVAFELGVDLLAVSFLRYYWLVGWIGSVSFAAVLAVGDPFLFFFFSLVDHREDHACIDQSVCRFHGRLHTYSTRLSLESLALFTPPTNGIQAQKDAGRKRQESVIMTTHILRNQSRNHDKARVSLV